MEKSNGKNAASPVSAMFGIVAGAAAGLSVSVIMLLAAAFGISGGVLGTEDQYRITLLVCFISTAAGGFLAMRWRRGILMGVGVSAAYYLCLLTVGLLLYDIHPLDSRGMGILLSALLGGGLSGVLGARRRKERRGKRR